MASDDLVIVKVAPFNAEATLTTLQEDVTPNEQFYVRSNFAVPKVDSASYRLVVDGAVERPRAFSLDELRALGTQQVLTTMECAGNHRMSLLPLPSGEPWQGGAVSTARWTGVLLRTVLDCAHVRREAVEILASGADHGEPDDGPGDIAFARSLPLTLARHDDTLLAFAMNGEPLPPAHGAPLRLIVPGWYGMASVKWVTRIEAITEPFTGYYQKSRYIFDYDDGNEPPPVTTMLPRAIIVTPQEADTVTAGLVQITGKAWSGTGEIVRVEVTVDGGDNWRDAHLLPAPSPYAWRRWEYTWEASDPGRHALRARATDASGQTQPAIARWNKYGYGSNGVRAMAVNVR